MYCPHVQARVYRAGVAGGEGMGDRRSPLRATRRQIRLREPADKPESMAKALRALGPAHPATCPRAFAGPRTGPERTTVREDRKRRTGEPAARIVGRR
jgi:hypothetical protein